jgi:hypothetical protein
MGNTLPAPIVALAFPTYNGEPTELSADGLTIEIKFNTEQPILNLSPLIKIELL